MSLKIKFQTQTQKKSSQRIGRFIPAIIPYPGPGWTNPFQLNPKPPVSHPQPSATAELPEPHEHAAVSIESWLFFVRDSYNGI